MAITKASSNAVSPAAKGDLVVGSATNDSGVLAVGSTDQVLTVDSSTATGLKWTTPASTGMTLLSTTNLSSTSTTVSDISQSYTNLFIQIDGAYTSGIQTPTTLRVNGITTATYSTSTHTPGQQTNWDNTANQTKMNFSVYTNSSANNNIVQITIPNYTSSQLKRFSWTGSAVAFNSTTVGYGRMSNFTSAITSITIANDDNATFLGGTIKIYGANL